MRLESKDITDENIKKILELFPNVATEAKDENGKLRTAIDFDKLKQELLKDVVDGEECYDFTWVGKKEAMVEANRPIRKTLRPCRDKSLNWEDTENIYIEGDNLEALKLLQESYLGKVKMIYIDPPYNTGKDFVYKDNFHKNNEDNDKDINYKNDEEEINFSKSNELFLNTESNGRFHSDWCSMIYSRLKLARNLLSDDGVIFISIDDNEVRNLKNICDEVFGEENFLCNFVWEKTVNPNSTSNNIGICHESILCYSKQEAQLNLLPLSNEDIAKYTGRDEFYLKRGGYKLVGLNKTGTLSDKRPNLEYDIIAPDGSIIKPQPRWRWSKDTFEKGLSEGRIVFSKNNDKWTVYYKQYMNEDNYGNIIDRGNLVKTILSNVGRTTNGSNELAEIIGKGIFDFPKPSTLIQHLLKTSTNKEAIILDFFSGSATTAHACMQLNAEDGGKRKFIMVQIPQTCDEKSEAFKAGYKNICEIGEERIRRAGKKILEENPDKKIDVGFRVFKVDDTNMKDVYYSPSETTQQNLFESNIKDDRTDEDLLYGCLLDWGVELSLPHRVEIIEGKRVHIVDEDALVACFEENIPESVIRKIAGMKPLRVVFRDSSFNSDDNKINVEEIFKLITPDTRVKVI